MAKPNSEPHHGVTITMEDARKSVAQGIQQMAANIVMARRNAEPKKVSPKDH